jgi:predicted nuclease with TOPRIM domain
VDESAQCFNSYQCNYEGFTCKSNVTECVDDYNGLLERNNALVDDYNDLLKRHKKLVTDYNDVLGDYETLRNEASKLDSEHSDLKDCVGYADDLEDAQDCAW